MNSPSLPSLKGNILIVDDHPDNLRILSSMLISRGYYVRKALNGQMALMACQTAPPDLILLDINMPDMNGYEVCEALKSNEKTHEIPVIFISVLDSVWDKVRAFQVGGSDYITKPFQLEEVAVRVANQLMIQNLQKTLYEKNQLLQQQNQLLINEVEKRKEAEKALQTANERLQHLATSDGLTGLFNRRHFDEYLEQEWRRSTREEIPLSLVLGDIDYFKAYNDTYGHPQGDICLIKVAHALQKVVKRPADLAARYGGEEFAIILPNTHLEGAISVVHSIQLEVQKLKIVHRLSNVNPYVTLSLGISSIVPRHQKSTEILIADADKALYQAKKRGRNQYCACIEKSEIESSSNLGIEIISKDFPHCQIKNTCSKTYLFQS